MSGSSGRRGTRAALYRGRQRMSSAEPRPGECPVENMLKNGELIVEFVTVFGRPPITPRCLHSPKRTTPKGATTVLPRSTSRKGTRDFTLAYIGRAVTRRPQIPCPPRRGHVRYDSGTSGLHNRQARRRATVNSQHLLATSDVGYGWRFPQRSASGVGRRRRPLHL